MAEPAVHLALLDAAGHHQRAEAMMRRLAVAEPPSGEHVDALLRRLEPGPSRTEPPERTAARWREVAEFLDRQLPRFDGDRSWYRGRFECARILAGLELGQLDGLADRVIAELARRPPPLAGTWLPDESDLGTLAVRVAMATDDAAGMREAIADAARAQPTSVRLPLAWAVLCVVLGESLDEPLALASKRTEHYPGFRERTLAELHGAGPADVADAWAAVGRALADRTDVELPRH